MDFDNHQQNDETSYVVGRQTPDIDGLCHDYTLRRHKHEQRANEGSFRCRADWTNYIGPIERWGCCNPYEGHFSSVVLPLCKPERLELVSYIFECIGIIPDLLSITSRERGELTAVSSLQMPFSMTMYWNQYRRPW
jgi:hypothetical protein